MFRKVYKESPNSTTRRIERFCKGVWGPHLLLGPWGRMVLPGLIHSLNFSCCTKVVVLLCLKKKQKTQPNNLYTECRSHHSPVNTPTRWQVCCASLRSLCSDWTISLREQGLTATDVFFDVWHLSHGSRIQFRSQPLYRSVKSDLFGKCKIETNVWFSIHETRFRFWSEGFHGPQTGTLQNETYMSDILVSESLTDCQF